MKKIYSLLLIGICSFSFGQMDNFTYKRALNGISEQWHLLNLPNNVLSKSHNLNDLRIYGITEKDTIEAPYILKTTEDKIIRKELECSVINRSKVKNNYYFTVKIASKEAINQLKLQFENKNFDWHITLEGSQNQQKWFTIITDYRILSIKNSQSDFSFTDLDFPTSEYKFYRIVVRSEKEPKLSKISVFENQVTAGKSVVYTPKKITKTENKKEHETDIKIVFPTAVAINKLSLKLSDEFDYYRPIKIQTLVDSISTEKGIKYNYKTIFSGTLNSLEKSNFSFKNTLANQLKISIENGNNQPLNIGDIQIKGAITQMKIRFTKKGNYYLYYGNKNAQKRTYDIERFTKNIPTELTAISLGEEEVLQKQTTEKNPIFKNKMWLWVIMIIIIAMLGWFSVKMLQKK